MIKQKVKKCHHGSCSQVVSPRENEPTERLIKNIYITSFTLLLSLNWKLINQSGGLPHPLSLSKSKNCYLCNASRKNDDMKI